MNIEIIAELGQGFEGRPEQARLLMKAAAAAGADAGKYQLVYADELATPDYKYYDLFRSLEMEDDVWKGLGDYAAELGIRLYLDIFGLQGLRLADQLGVPAVKLHPTDIANIGLLEQVAASSIPRVLLGAGGAFLDELERALKILSEKELVVLLGFQGYPTPDDSNQIARVTLLAERFRGLYPRVIMGFADHPQTDSPLRYAIPATAIGAGARVLEKHLTLGQVMKMEDYESALNPDEFAEFSRIVRGCAAAYGEAVDAMDFGMSQAEGAYRKTIRRQVVLRSDQAAGACLEPTDLNLKRTSAEDALTDLNLAYGKKLNRDLAVNSPVRIQDLT